MSDAAMIDRRDGELGRLASEALGTPCAPRPTLHMCGINYNSAPLAIRERFALCPSRCAEELRRLREAGLAEQILILSTCNRTELYAFSTHGCFESELAAALRGLADPPIDATLIYRHRGVEAARHLFAVGAGLDSMILGENQVKGQLRAAYERSREHDAAGPDLARLVEAAFRAGKRIRSETELNSGTLDVGKAAVLQGETVLEGLAGRVCILLGAGKIGTVAARAIAERRPGRLLIVNRTLERAQPLANELGGEAFGIEALPKLLPEADFVLGAAYAPGLLLDRAVWERAYGGPRPPRRRLCMVDAAVPRSIDPALALIDGIELFDIEHMEEIVARNRERRQCAAQAAWRIIESELSCYREALVSAELGPTITRLSRRFDELFEQEIPGCDEESQTRRRLKQRLLHAVICEIKSIHGTGR